MLVFNQWDVGILVGMNLCFTEGRARDIAGFTVTQIFLLQDLETTYRKEISMSLGLTF